MSSLPFAFPGFLVTKVIVTTQQLVVYATSQATQAVCPRCQEISSRVHSYYTRSLADAARAAVGGFSLSSVSVVFAGATQHANSKPRLERLPALPVSARQTSRLGTILESLAVVLSGEAGSRLAQQ